MLRDRYENKLSTRVAAARDAYVAASDLQLSGQPGAIESFTAACDADPGFALAWVGLARACQYADDPAGASAAMAQARVHATGLTAREASHFHAFDLLISGQTQHAYAAIRAHMDEWPRDALLAQTCSSVFGLIGFSGQPGREAETLAFTAALARHCPDDWWALSQHAFALCETGNLAAADRLIDRALELKPDNAHGAHVRSHVSYEMGETAVGRSYLDAFLVQYDPRGVMFTHLNWHSALWALKEGNAAAMWERVDTAVAPDARSTSPAINILTDTVAILHRAALAGIEVPDSRWREVSDFAAERFPKTGVAFIDVHAALAHAMAGRADAVEQIIEHPAGPAADIVPDLARGFRAMAAGDWSGVHRCMTRAMSDLARMGGSRAQRDMVEQTLLHALVRTGRAEEARDIAALRRPLLSGVVAA